MPKRIESLTEEQLAAIPAFREECLKKALSTETIDRKKAKAAINNLYEAGGLEKPDLILFAESPMQALLMCSALRLLSSTFKGQLWNQLWNQLGGQLWDRLGSQLKSQLRGQLWGQIRGDQLWGQPGGQIFSQIQDQLRGQFEDQIEDQLEGQLWRQLRDQICDQIRHQLCDQIRHQLCDQIRHQLWDQIRDQLWDKLMRTGHHGAYQSLFFEGGWDYYWVANHRYAETIGVEYDKGTKKHLDAYIEYADTCGCAYLYEKIAFVCDRPEIIKFDQEGRLSNEPGPALKFRDGYSLYFVRGVLVPERWVTDDLPPASELLKWKNMEQRIIGCEMAGWHNIIDELNCTVLDDDNDPMIGSLIQVNDMPDADGPEYYLKAKCGTGRTVCMNVNPAVIQDKAKTAIEANAATYQLFKNGEWVSNYTAAMYRNASAERT